MFTHFKKCTWQFRKMLYNIKNVSYSRVLVAGVAEEAHPRVGPVLHLHLLSCACVRAADLTPPCFLVSAHGHGKGKWTTDVLDQEVEMPWWDPPLFHWNPAIWMDGWMDVLASSWQMYNTHTCYKKLQLVLVRCEMNTCNCTLSSFLGQ